MIFKQPRSFTKMQALGNDIVIIDGLLDAWMWAEACVPVIADRRFGVGCDQVIIMTHRQSNVFFLKIFNQDGSEVGQCGNGLRCVAQYLFHRGYVDSDFLDLVVHEVRYRAKLKDKKIVVDMGLPAWHHDDIPDSTVLAFDGARMVLGGHAWTVGWVHVGNPHAVVLVDDASQLNVECLAEQLLAQSSCPEGANVGFASIINRREMRLRVVERGVGETQACGSGACASVALSHRADYVDDEVMVHMAGGVLDVAVHKYGHLKLTGDAVEVFSGIGLW